MSKENKPFYKRGLFYILVLAVITFTARCIVEGLLVGWESVFDYVFNIAFGAVLYSFIRDILGSVSENLLKEKVRLQNEVIEHYDKAFHAMQDDVNEERARAENYYMGYIPLFRKLYEAVAAQEDLTENEKEILALTKIIDHQVSYITALELESNELRKRVENNTIATIEEKKQCLI